MAWHDGARLSNRQEKEHRVTCTRDWQLPRLDARRHLAPPQVVEEVGHAGVTRCDHPLGDVDAALFEGGLDARHPRLAFDDRVVWLPTGFCRTHDAPSLMRSALPSQRSDLTLRRALVKAAGHPMFDGPGRDLRPRPD